MPDAHSNIPGLIDIHYRHITSSGISDDVIRARGYRSITAGNEMDPLGFSRSQRRAPGILIPVYSPDGSSGEPIYRPDNPRILKGKNIKYEAVPGASLHLDVNPLNKDKRNDPGIDLWITEGAKKADALTSRGEYAVNLNGVWGFKGRNEFGATALLVDFDLIAWQGRTVYLAFDSDVTTKHQVKAALERLEEIVKRKGAHVKIILLPGELHGEAQKVGVDDYLAAGHSIEDLKALVVEGLLDQEDDLVLHSTAYRVHEGKYCQVKNNNGIDMLVPLCNFTAKIQGEVILDNGLEETRNFEITGEKDGKALPAIEIPSNQFNSLSWVTEKWGAGTVVYAGSAVKDHLRTVIQLQAANNGFCSRRVYTHTGWRHVDGEHLFLTSSGAVGRDDVQAQITGPLSRYSLPNSLEGVDITEAVKASLRFMAIGDPEVQNVLWASMYLAPLCEILDPAFSIWMTGHTGSFKSVMSALALCHYGEFTASSLPACWMDTENSIERAMFIAKDLPLVIDDWHPASNSKETHDLERKADRIIRGQGNRSGRGRLRADATARETYIPRGLVIATAEQIPQGESGASRLLVLEQEEKRVDRGSLNIAMDESGKYRYAMAAYICWLRDNWEDISDYCKSKWREYRDKAIAEGVHLRIPGAVAWLTVATETARAFAHEVGAISPDQGQELLDSTWSHLIRLAGKQGWRVDQERPAKRFVDGLETLFNQQKVLTVGKSMLEPMPDQLKTGKQFIGWYDDEYYYLLPQAAYGAVYEYSNKSGQPFTFKAAAVWADLSRLGYLTSDNGRNQSVVWVGSGTADGASKRVIQLRKSVLSHVTEK